VQVVKRRKLSAFRHISSKDW